MSFFDDHIIISDMSSMFKKAKKNAPKKEERKAIDDKFIMNKQVSTDSKNGVRLAMKK
nr:MAG TPA: hypothetical protein [Caudoviricetes sp.]